MQSTFWIWTQVIFFGSTTTLSGWQSSSSVSSRSAAEPIELTTRNLSQYLPGLHSKNSRQSYIVKQPVVLTSLAEQWTLNNLEFQAGGVLYIGATKLQLDIRGVLIAPPGKTTIFSSFVKREADSGNSGSGGPGAGGRGTDGGNGQDGHSSGVLTLQLHALPSRAFRIALFGQSGGHGGNGGPGSPGANGQKGRPGESGPFGCNRGGDNGSSGAPGGDGGNPGSGGSCGAGGLVTVIVPEALESRIQRMIEIDDASAMPGSPGDPGAPGAGGRGGDGGDGNGFCGGGRPGASGPPGRPGVLISVNRAPCAPPSIQIIAIPQ